jgi:putative peptidoglycan lipid II flippase
VPGLIKYNYRWRPTVDFKEPYTRKVFKVMGPRLITMFLIQMVFIMQDNMASGLETGAISALMYAYWIMQIPQTLLGTSVATAVLPTLSELFNNERFDEFKAKIEHATKVMLVLTIPVAVIAAVVVEPAIAVFIRGLDAQGIARVTLVTRIFLAGIIGQYLVELFARTFYAQQKPFVPMLGAGLTLAIFVGAGFGLRALLPSWGIASEAGIVVANVIAYSAQAVLLFVLLNHRLVNVLGTEKLQTCLVFGKAVIAALIGGGLAFAIINYLPRFQHTLIGAMIAGLLGLVIAAVVIRKELVYIRSL